MVGEVEEDAPPAATWLTEVCITVTCLEIHKNIGLTLLVYYIGDILPFGFIFFFWSNRTNIATRPPYKGIARKLVLA